jgi:outer membrane protein OmpA-like peptidoglycan-associated protein
VTLTFSCVFTNLTAGTLHSVSALATNSVGSSSAATANFTTLTAVVPTPPVVVPPVVVPPVVVPPVVVPPVVPEIAAPTKPVLQVIAKHVTSVLANNVPRLAGAVIVAPVLFNPYSAKLDAKDLATLRQAVGILKGQQGVLLVTGFVKFEGRPTALNRKLALARAKTVALTLAKLGIKVQIGFAGYGPLNTKTPRATDRKVELRWVAAS